MSKSKVLTSTILALLSFSGNSVLCRMALGEETIDAASFTLIRLMSGAIVLFLILKLSVASKDGNNVSRGSWRSALMLFLYASAFSYAYISLDTASGALILFASVQITIVLASLFVGRKLSPMEWLGVLVSFSGFVYLMLPGATAPSLVGFVLMAISGVAWGMYTLLGKGSVSALSDTAFNFIRTIPFCSVLIVLVLVQGQISPTGVVLAILSGGVASGLGYTIWYVALGGLNNIQAAVVQLFVPVIAALGGVIFVGETLSLQLLVSALIILCGVSLVNFGKR